MAMLLSPLHTGSDVETRWALDEADALFRFQEGVRDEPRRRSIAAARQWWENAADADRAWMRAAAHEAAGRSPAAWDDADWEAFALHVLWQVVDRGMPTMHDAPAQPPRSWRLAQRMQDAGCDPDALVHPELIRFCGAFLDQGYAPWRLPGREEGFLRSFAALHRAAPSREPWLADLPRELDRLERDGWAPLRSIAHSLHLLGVDAATAPLFIEQTLLALRGWTGMLWQMETNGSWTAYPAPPGTLVEFLAVRLVLDRLAAEHLARQQWGYYGPLADLPLAQDAAPAGAASGTALLRKKMLVFQLAQLRGWTPRELAGLTPAEWNRLLAEVDAFSEWERRRMYQLAYERRFREQTLDGLAAFAIQGGSLATRSAPAYQALFCIDDREESLRRHLEECDPDVETCGIAGFFGVAMYYRGVSDAQFRPLCPVNIQPRHYVIEEPVYSLLATSRRQAEARRQVARVTRGLHLQSRTALGGAVTGLFGAVASLPMVLRILLPRTAAKLGSLAETVIQPSLTQLRLERLAEEPGPGDAQLGFSVAEMADIVAGGLRTVGLGDRLAPLVLVVGHGSASLNNPHEAAYDCGACGGGRGGPNARAFAQMANDDRVRRLLAARGLTIPAETWFVGAYHNTCDDNLEYFDLDRLPFACRPLFERARDALETACRKDAHERCRRFQSAPADITLDGALRHVEERSQDLSQVRPEYCHAGNAVCVVARRERTRGLFLDRRAFLTSYDPTRDDDQGSVLRGLLGAVIPVCAGISLEYYFSAVDPIGFGCGSKLPHNLASLLGVMEGAQSDLRTGLSAQMTEIHEPMRILFVIETTPAVLEQVLAQLPAVERLVRHRWVQLATLDPDGPQLHVIQDGRSVPYRPHSEDLPQVPSSLDWYRGQRGNLGCASIGLDSGALSGVRPGASS
jgi:uncharacterized protein YbcC (UPF0753/DUF2309 family)